ncbi:hypothetical protein [Ruminococcus sp.]|uniref:hypothetical protein n=1 Tax=Ruminococcus sp. TaxID=41978 RepID=UPI003AF8FD07
MKIAIGLEIFLNFSEAAAVDESSWAKHDGTGQWPVPRQWDDVDTLVNTLTGNIHLTPTAPEHSGYTQNSVKFSFTMVVVVSSPRYSSIPTPIPNLKLGSDKYSFNGL